MTVEEIRAQLPEAEVYELKPDSKYLLVVARQSVSRAAAEAIVRFLPATCVLRVDDTDQAVRLLEVK